MINGHTHQMEESGPPLPASTRDVIEHVIGQDREEAPAENAPRYRIRVTDFDQRIKFEQAFITAGGRVVSRADVIQALRDVIPEVVAEEQQAAAVELLDHLGALEEQVKAETGALPPPPADDATPEQREAYTQQTAGLTKLLREYGELLLSTNKLELLARERSSTFGSLVAHHLKWFEIMCFKAFQHFVRGWDHVTDLEGTRLVYRSRNGVVDAAVLEPLALQHPEHIAEVGARCISLLKPTATQKKSSGSPSTSP